MRAGSANTMYRKVVWVALFGIPNTTKSNVAVGTDQVEDLWVLRKDGNCSQDAVMAFATCPVDLDEVSNKYEVYSTKIFHCHLRVRPAFSSGLLIPTGWDGRTGRR
jgi:hypothetical protein